MKSFITRWAVAAFCALLPLAAPASDEPPRGMAFEVYIRLELGMTEGELLLRAGKPDQRSNDDIRGAQKTFYYYPTAANPHLTTITLRAGRIANIERIRQSQR